MSIVQNTVPRPGRWITVPDEPRPSRSSRELIGLAERALRTGQPNLAALYLRRADVASDYERFDREFALAVYRYGALVGPLVHAYRPIVQAVQNAIEAVGSVFDAFAGSLVATCDDFSLAGPGKAS
ncbi:hypothetical protein SPF06_07165 [Sinomonas sp. JGH33]|uniref:SAV-6107-like HEPN domain-containing protein n=1 Tax=Sinomonas terricola TaxID=3110330 RepID=A0ABU5T4M0_9MICC|nr:hypothetical protein [Sinomonas sp. JGH33]MEA5454497.1 hypothetical protein [Sinomonas sp. JGH33]